MLQVHERRSSGELAGGRDVSSLALLATAAVQRLRDGFGPLFEHIE